MIPANMGDLMTSWGDRRCEGITARGTRCRRSEYGSPREPYYCHQHQWQAEPPGYSAGVAELGYGGDG